MKQDIEGEINKIQEKQRNPTYMKAAVQGDRQITRSRSVEMQTRSCDV